MTVTITEDESGRLLFSSSTKPPRNATQTRSSEMNRKSKKRKGTIKYKKLLNKKKIKDRIPNNINVTVCAR